MVRGGQGGMVRAHAKFKGRACLRLLPFLLGPKPWVFLGGRGSHALDKERPGTT